jgi:hypothetical protein
MVICFSCTPETKVQLDRLVASGHYTDHSQVIAAAIQNLAVIHSELRQTASIILDRNALTSLSGIDSVAPSATLEKEPVAPLSNSASENPLSRRQAPGSSAIPMLFHRHEEITPPTQFASFDVERVKSAKDAPIDAWMFGQYNRLLPAKITSRALVNLLMEGGAHQPLEKLAMTIANEAAKLGQYFSSLDEKRHLGRDDAISVAFPKHWTEFKSIQRFANQFVGSSNKKGQLLGLAISLKLVGRNPEYPDSIALSEAGWKFAVIENPLIDGIAAGSTEKFSDEEISFLLNHIVTSVPIEAFAYRTILNEVARGVLTPDDLDVVLSKLSGHSTKTQAQFVSTQRSGAICRMVDLNLIGRSRTGTRVSYMLMPRGKGFLESAKVATLDAPKSGPA